MTIYGHNQRQVQKRGNSNTVSWTNPKAWISSNLLASPKMASGSSDDNAGTCRNNSTKTETGLSLALPWQLFPKTGGGFMNFIWGHVSLITCLFRAGFLFTRHIYYCVNIVWLGKGFDCVNHGILEGKLEFYGIRILNVIQSYPKGRYQNYSLVQLMHMIVILLDRKYL